MSPLSTPRRRGAPLGNSNGFKHGLYSKRVKKRDPSADDAIVLKSLADEIALIRVFTQRLIDNLDPSASASELTDILRILCFSSTTITRILRVHFLITDSETILDSDIEAAVQQVNARLRAKQPSIAQLLAAGMVGDLPSSTPHPQEERN
jgi:hypothetical protein